MLNKLTRGGFIYRAGVTMLSSSTSSSSSAALWKSPRFLSSGVFSGGASRKRVAFPVRFQRASAVRCFASSGGGSDRIQVQNPIVEMDGEIHCAASVVY